MWLVRLRDRWLALDRFRRRIGRRGAALIAFAYIDLVVGWGLLNPELRSETASVPVYRALLNIAPLGVWACLWLGVALLCLLQAPARDDRWAYSLAIGIKVVWAGGMLWAWLVFAAARGWLSASLWLTVAALLVIINGWPEPGADHVPRTDDGPS